MRLSEAIALGKTIVGQTISRYVTPYEPIPPQPFWGPIFFQLAVVGLVMLIIRIVMR